MIRLLICCLLVFPLTILSQEYREINVQRLGVEQGLLHHTVNSLYQDEFGFIWIGTMDGLNRYDGRKITAFKPSPNDTLSISENNIRHVCGDQNGHIFIKGLESVSQYDMHTNRFKVIRDRGVMAISCMNQQMYMAIDGDIFTYNSNTEVIQLQFSFKAHQLSNVRIACFTVSAKGELYICTKKNGYYKINKSGNIIQHLELGEANSILHDSKDNIWIATRDEGLYCINQRGELKRYEHNPSDPTSIGHNNVRNICEDNSGKFFVGTFEGLSTLDVEAGKFTHYRYEFKRAAFNIRSIITMMQDHQGTLWIGTFYEGLHCYNMEYDIYRYYYPSNDVPNRLSSPIVSSITEDNDGTIWISTEGGGLNALNPKTKAIKVFRHDGGGLHICSDVIKSTLYEPSENILWIATLYDGIDRIDLNTNTIRHINNKIIEKNVVKGEVQNIVNMLSMGDSLLLATNRGVVVLNKKTLQLSRFNAGFTFDHRAQIWDMKLDTKGLLWLTSSTDLFCVNVQNKISKRYLFKDIANSRVNNHLNSILRDSEGNMWFGSSGSGIFKYDRASDSFKNYNSDYGLENSYITDLYQDSATGLIYIATNWGLSRFDPATEKFENFNIRNGFPLTVINENSLFISKGGTLFACGLNGLVSVSPNLLGVNSRDYQVYVSDIYIDNKQVLPLKDNAVLYQSILFQKQIELKPRHSVISFEFTNNDYLNTYHSKMEYKLVGFDKNFIDAGENNSATYTNLNPGKYTFMVRGSTQDSHIQYPTAQIEVVVLTPFYRSFLFIALCVVLLLSIIIYLIRAYTLSIRLRSSLESEKREKEHIEQVNLSKFRFFTNVSHEFRTPLTLINGQLEMLLQKNDIRPSVYAKILNVYKNSQRLRRLVDEIIDIRKQEQGYMKLKVCKLDIVAFMQEIFLSFEEYALYHGINYIFHSTQVPIMLWFDPEQMEKVINNLLSNAFKYTKSGTSITLSIEQRETEVEIVVSDTGLGITTEHLAHIFERFYQDDATNATITDKGSGVGLALSKAIVEMHSGHIYVKSDPNILTEFTVVLRKGDHFSSDHVLKIDTKNNPNRYITGYTQEVLSDSATTANDSPKSVKMLIVEDSHDVRELLTQIFEPLYTIHTANDGEQGIEKAKELQPDIILSDIMMPKMSGVAMCTKLKNDIDTCHIPIVLLTARNADEHTIEGLLTGADDYITKPFNVKLLVARCNNLVSGRRRLQEKYMHQPDSSVTMLTTNPTDQKLLERAVEIAQAHISNVEFDINTFSKELGISRTYLFAKIKGLTGQTPNEFIVNIRLKNAAIRLVKDPQASMSDIAYDLGFNSPSYFARCFKEVYGKTPNMYRKEMASKTKS